MSPAEGTASPAGRHLLTRVSVTPATGFEMGSNWLQGISQRNCVLFGKASLSLSISPASFSRSGPKRRCWVRTSRRATASPLQDQLLVRASGRAAFLAFWRGGAGVLSNKPNAWTLPELAGLTQSRETRAISSGNCTPAHRFMQTQSHLQAQRLSSHRCWLCRCFPSQQPPRTPRFIALTVAQHHPCFRTGSQNPSLRSPSG